MKRILAIFDSDENYSEAFMRYVNCQKQMPFEVYAFTDPENLICTARKKKLSVLLISERERIDEALKKNIPYIVVLSENGGSQEDLAEAYPCVFKYQAASGIIKKILAGYTGDSQEFPLSGASCRKIGVFSPTGRCGKTSFALTLGLLLAEKSSVLYSNLSLCSGFSQLLHRSYTGGLSDGIYYLRSGDHHAADKMLAQAERIGEMSYLPPFASPEELLSVSTAEWEALFLGLIQAGGIEDLILDLGDLPLYQPEILSFCDVILEIDPGDAISAAKIAEYNEFLKKREMEFIKNQMKMVRLPQMDSMENMDRYPELLPFGSLGTYAKEVILEYEL